MVPTYFRRELRDRVLQRRSRLRTFFAWFVLVETTAASSVDVMLRLARRIQYAAAFV